MSLLVFGKTGQVATELARRAPEATFLGRDAADLSDPAACAAAIRARAPEAVINAAAYTAVDRAEDEEDLATTINGAAPGAMAAACAALGIPFVHISTDYVFDGAGTAAFAPDAPVAPLGTYGRSKLAGEEAVRAAGGAHVILRTSWVVSAHGGNFVKTMLRLSETRDRLTIVADQIGGPTAAGPIAQACLTAAGRLTTDPNLAGTYHFSGAPDTSWADFAREIFRQSGRTVEVVDIPASEFPTPAKRPANSRMDCTTLTRLGIDRPDWRMDLTEILTELGARR
ncbi:dTDP-4-dehydrorhamnose reductase [Roseisalinus antarcticus]|uniref:dTDP-4-dehydrorhamnose reductase n=1 Tax=Roseisalinus antarcticus TaxID=254357 RepID=A0A1Y5TPX7_9RHOB|nr:dTDP-4-dehydrorhamnose reductase [Roseisalinus antarcticus]SLN69173.1 dTDP-4-dehydrorhamnose reductase [Roseisalinus antarcticus]